MAALTLHSCPGRVTNSVIYHGGDGFLYHLNNNRTNRHFAYLRCIHYRSAKYHYCPGTAKAIMEMGVIYHLRPHYHPPNVWAPHVRALKQDIIARVKSGDQTPLNEIIQQEGQKYPLKVRSQVSFGSIISRLNCIRASLRPPVPRSLGVLGACLLLDQYKYLTQCQHVPHSLYAGMCGKMGDGTLSLVFISPEMREFMPTRNQVFVDGTERRLFRKPKASQIMNIAAAWRFHVLVMLRAIMLRRTEAAYVELLQFIKTLMPQFNPRYVKCDFEDAQVNAWRSCFPTASVEGCLWHYDVAVYSMARNKLGLYHLVKDEEEVASIIRSTGALPLLPTEEIEQGLHDLGSEATDKGWMQQLRPFFKYMQREWMPKVAILSVADSVHRTNNVSESANRALNKEIKVSNPSCFEVLRAFVATNEKYTVDLHTLAEGHAPGRGRKISALRNDVTIKRLTTDFRNGDITRLQFLHRASRRMQNVFNKVYK